MSKPVGFSKSSAGPPPADLQARSVTAAISRSGLTGSATRLSRRRRSRSDRNAARSSYMGVRIAGARRSPSELHLLHDGISQLERPAAVFSGHRRSASRNHGVDEILQLALERFLVGHFEVAPLDRRHP